jgi:hypothetical protein
VPQNPGAMMHVSVYPPLYNRWRGRVRGLGVVSLLLGGGLLAACGGNQTAAPPASSSTVASIVATAAADTLTALGQTSQLTAVAKDASGGTLTGVTIVWSSSAPGMVSVDSASGLATAVANGTATITASAGGQSAQVALTVAQAVASVTVTPGTASLVALGATEAFGAAAVDANNNAVTNVTFLWVSSDPTVATVDTTGLATAKKAGTATITAAARGVPGNAVLTVTQTAKELAFTIEPTDATAGAALSPAIQVTIEDSTGARVPDATDAITLALSPNPGSGTLAGTRTVNAVDGVATFSGLWIDKAATGYGLQATAGGLTAAASAPFAVSAAAAAQLAFSAEPADATAGVALSPAVAVTVEDLYGNPVSGATNSVTVALGAGNAALLGTTTISAASGVASFSGLSIQQAGSGYTLVASSGVLAAATSTTFAITPAAAKRLGFTVQPSQAEGSDSITPAVAVAVQDTFGNTITGATNAITLAIGTNAGREGGGTLSGTTTVNAVSGIATFPTAAIDQPGNGYTLAASATGLTGATSSGFNVVLTFAAVKTGLDHSCGLTPSGAAYCWGEGLSGALGDNSTANHLTPVVVVGGVPFTSLTTGNAHVCAVARNGAAYCWGYNADGELGNGTTSSPGDSTPQVVAGGLTFSQVSGGAGHTCGVTTGGSAYCWGTNTYGQLGDNMTSGSTTPVAVAGGLTFATISAGWEHTCGVTLTGNGYCWGANTSGQLGDNSTQSDSVPVLIAGFAFAAVHAGSGHTCGVTTAGAAYCWGDGPLGNGTGGRDSLPVAVWGSLTFTDLGLGLASCGVTVGAVGYCWGSNNWGQLGDGTTGQSDVPIRVFGQP